MAPTSTKKDETSKDVNYIYYEWQLVKRRWVKLPITKERTKNNTKQCNPV